MNNSLYGAVIKNIKKINYTVDYWCSIYCTYTKKQC